MESKFYEVVAKCGHVGRGYYYEGHFFVVDFTASHAAQRVKGYARVKRDHEDAILGVYEVDENTYKLGVEAMQVNPYFLATNETMQVEHWTEIEPFVHPETDSILKYRKKHHKRVYDQRDEVECSAKSGGVRDPYKYAKYNGYDVLRYCY